VLGGRLLDDVRLDISEQRPVDHLWLGEVPTDTSRNRQRGHVGRVVFGESEGIPDWTNTTSFLLCDRDTLPSLEAVFREVVRPVGRGIGEDTLLEILSLHLINICRGRPCGDEGVSGMQRGQGGKPGTIVGVSMFFLICLAMETSYSDLSSGVDKTL
jgi:hypothetical protein